ncbi:MAG TPA: MarR family transcriptional regulator [Firmicutes bacterium]|nr:MarR family transcriptional regulator [Bacillota bacterium]
MQKNSPGKLISQLFRYGRIYLARQLEPFDLGKGQFWLLFTLYQKEGITQEDLSQSLTLDKSTIARSVTRLEKAGYIYRKLSERDQRAYQIFLTEKAKKIGPQIHSILLKWNEVLSTGMSKEEIAAAHRLLIKLADNAANYLDK